MSQDPSEETFAAGMVSDAVAVVDYSASACDVMHPARENSEPGRHEPRTLVTEPHRTTAQQCPHETLAANPLTLALANPSDAQTRDGNRRLVVLQAYAELQADSLEATGKELSLEQAARKLRVPQTNLWRLLKQWREKGQDYNALLPDYHKRGRKSTLVKLATQLGVETVQDNVARVKGLNHDTESNTAAWRAYAQSDQCPEEIARVVLDPTKSSKHALPPSLRSATKLSQAERDAHRGARRLSLGGMWIPRRIDVLPGDIYSSDDTTAIWGAWVPWVQNEDYPFGIKVLQLQHFPIIDVASQCVLGFALVAREKSSYRGCDLWHQVFGQTMRLRGLPRLGWQVERGTWESNLIAGEEIEWEDGDGITLSRRVGGLRQLPTKLTKWHEEKLGDAARAFPRTLQTFTSYLPKSKSVEALINRSQTYEGTIYGSLGRDQMRRPFEKMKKLFQHCSKPGAREDGRHHFLSITEIAQRLHGIYEYLNNEPMEGEVFKGVPRLVYDATMAEYPPHLLPEDQQWLYLRDWKRTRITQGWARLRLTHPVTKEKFSLFYTNPAVFAQPGIEGEEVIVYYDLQNYEQPAQIILARTGDFLCSAQYFERVGSFLDHERTGHEVCKAWRNAVISVYRSVAVHAPSRQLPPEIAARREASRLSEPSITQELPDSRDVAAVPPQPKTSQPVALPYHLQKLLDEQ